VAFVLFVAQHILLPQQKEFSSNNSHFNAYVFLPDSVSIRETHNRSREFYCAANNSQKAQNPAQNNLKTIAKQPKDLPKNDCKTIPKQSPEIPKKPPKNHLRIFRKQFSFCGIICLAGLEMAGWSNGG